VVERKPTTFINPYFKELTLEAIERVELKDAHNTDLFERFAEVARGDHRKVWNGWSDQEKIDFIQEFGNDIQRHAEKAFHIGVAYGKSKT